MKVFVTGGTGFIGSHLCRRLGRQGAEVTVLRREESNTSLLADLSVRYHTGDVSDESGLEEAVAGHDCVIHAAADIHRGDPGTTPEQHINAVGARNVAAAARRQGVRRMVHISSVAAIGIPSRSEAPADENFRFNLEHSDLFYYRSKKIAEDFIQEQIRQGLDAVIVNPAWVFGPHGDDYRGADMIRKVRQGRLLTPYFMGGLCAVHVDDVVSGILAALDRGRCGERYILGGDNVSYRDAAQQAARAMGLRRILVPVLPIVTGVLFRLSELQTRLTGGRPWFPWVRHYFGAQTCYYASGRAQRELDYRPRGFDAILKDCLRSGAC